MTERSLVIVVVVVVGGVVFIALVAAAELVRALRDMVGMHQAGGGTRLRHST